MFEVKSHSERVAAVHYSCLRKHVLSCCRYVSLSSVFALVKIDVITSMILKSENAFPSKFKRRSYGCYLNWKLISVNLYQRKVKDQLKNP